MNAGAGVIAEIVKAVDSEKGASETLAKFVKRYQSDLELRKVNEIYAEFLGTGDPKKLDDAKLRLKNLLSSRGLESSGGGDINLKDRRKFKSEPGA
ncbi:MAG: hypothetical protein NTU61_02680 [Candidatus Altiarchaeota archaeon]|nr:hypothetical protein [Candidatus Altiarchaeota archaeon]